MSHRFTVLSLFLIVFASGCLDPKPTTQTEQPSQPGQTHSPKAEDFREVDHPEQSEFTPTDPPIERSVLQPQPKSWSKDFFQSGSPTIELSSLNLGNDNYLVTWLSNKSELNAGLFTRTGFEQVQKLGEIDLLSPLFLLKNDDDTANIYFLKDRNIYKQTWNKSSWLDPEKIMPDKKFDYLAVFQDKSGPVVVGSAGANFNIESKQSEGYIIATDLRTGSVTEISKKPHSELKLATSEGRTMIAWKTSDDTQIQAHLYEDGTWIPVAMQFNTSRKFGEQTGASSFAGDSFDLTIIGSSIALLYGFSSGASDKFIGTFNIALLDADAMNFVPVTLNSSFYAPSLTRGNSKIPEVYYETGDFKVHRLTFENSLWQKPTEVLNAHSSLMSTQAYRLNDEKTILLWENNDDMNISLLETGKETRTYRLAGRGKGAFFQLNEETSFPLFLDTAHGLLGKWISF